MLSEKIARILKSKSPFTAEQIEAMSDIDGWDWVYANASPRKEKLPSVCFTGFSQTEKDTLCAIALAARFRVVPSVTASLGFLCFGENAGPVKLARAKELGISLMDRSQFTNFLETGEIPN